MRHGEITGARQRVSEAMRAHAENLELEAKKLRVLAEEIERARLSGPAEDALSALFWRSR